MTFRYLFHRWTFLFLSSSLAFAIAHKQQPIAHNKLCLYSTMDSLPQQRNKRLLARPFSKSNKSHKSGKSSGAKSGKSSTSSVGNGSGGKSSKGYQLFNSKANKSSKGEAADGTTLTKSGKSDTKSGKGFKVSVIYDQIYAHIICMSNLYVVIYCLAAGYIIVKGKQVKQIA